MPVHRLFVLSEKFLAHVSQMIRQPVLSLKIEHQRNKKMLASLQFHCRPFLFVVAILFLTLTVGCKPAFKLVAGLSQNQSHQKVAIQSVRNDGNSPDKRPAVGNTAEIQEVKRSPKKEHSSTRNREEKEIRPKTTAKDVLVLEKRTFRDRGNGNIKSHTIYAPSDWKSKGAAWWPNKNYFRILPSQNIQVSGPDGTAVCVAPTMAFSDPRFTEYGSTLGIPRPKDYSSDAGYPVLKRPDNFQQWKTYMRTTVLKKKYPKAKNVRVKQVVEIPELTKQLEALSAPIRQQMEEQNRAVAQLGGGMSSELEIIAIAVECSYSLDGKRYDEIFVMGITSFVSHSPVAVGINWSVEPNISFRAPEGKLESRMPLMMSICGSLRPTSKWLRMKYQHMGVMSDIDAKAFKERSRLWSKTANEIREIQSRGRRRRNAIEDELHLRVTNSIRGVSDYSHGGEEFQLPHGFEHVYTDGFDRIIMTNNSLFDPNVDLNGTRNWERMKMVR